MIIRYLDPEGTVNIRVTKGLLRVDIGVSLVGGYLPLDAGEV